MIFYLLVDRTEDREDLEVLRADANDVAVDVATVIGFGTDAF